MDDLFDDQILDSYPRGHSVIQTWSEEKANEVRSRLIEVAVVVRPCITYNRKNVSVRTDRLTTVRILRKAGYFEHEISRFGFQDLISSRPFMAPTSEGSICTSCGYVDLEHSGAELTCPNCGKPMEVFSADERRV